MHHTTKNIVFRSTFTVSMMTAALAGCGGGWEEPTGVALQNIEQSGGGTGAVYALTNAVGDNRVVVYPRAANGLLTLSGSVPTGGSGSGVQLDPTDSLGSQGGLVLSEDHRFLFAVNTETSAADTDHDCNQGSITVFHVASDGSLTRAGEPVPSGGLFPNSLTVRGDTLYVLNSGGPDNCTGAPGFEVNPNLTGFTVALDGTLARIAGSVKTINPGIGPAPDLCAPASFGGGSPQFDCGLNPPAFPRSPGQISFTPNGDALVVTVKGTNSIHVFPMNRDGLPGDPAITTAPGDTLPTYFGFNFDSHDYLIVSEPFGSATSIPVVPASAVSSFQILPHGALKTITSSVPNGQGASCWIAVDPRTKRYAYTSNNATNSISVFAIENNGRLALVSGAEQELASDGILAAHPNDLAVALVGERHEDAISYLYSLNSGTGRVGMFEIQQDGSLLSLGEIGGLPEDAGAQGLAAF